MSRFKDKFIVVVIFVFLSFFHVACSFFSEKKSGEKVVYQMLSDSIFQELVKLNEDVDRDIWQKPELVMSKLGDLQGKNIVELYAKTGYFSFQMLKNAKKVIITDVNPRFVRFVDSVSMELPLVMSKKLEVRQSKMDSIALKANEAELFLMVNAIENINNLPNILANLSKLMPAQSKLVLVDYKPIETPIGASMELRKSCSDVTTQLQNAGFQVVEQDEFSLPYQYVISAMKQ